MGDDRSRGDALSCQGWGPGQAHHPVSLRHLPIPRRASVPGGWARGKHPCVFHVWLGTKPAQGLPRLSGTEPLHLNLRDGSDPSWTLVSWPARDGVSCSQSPSGTPHLKPPPASSQRGSFLTGSPLPRVCSSLELNSVLCSVLMGSPVLAEPRLISGPGAWQSGPIT